MKLQELADSIRAVGVLQNLIVHLLPDGLLGTAAGGRRFRALNILLNGGMITADYAVPVKTVSEEMAKSSPQRRTFSMKRCTLPTRLRCLVK